MSLSYCLLVNRPSYNNQDAILALQFIKSLIRCKHHISMIFFYQDGVYNASDYINFNSDENKISNSWHNLYIKYSINMHICVSAAVRRGILDSNFELDFTNKNNIKEGFKLSSLLTLAKELVICDRFMQF